MNLSPSEPIESVITRFYAAPQRRSGDGSGRPWWICPFHDDRNPSLCLIPGEASYHCFGCGSHGDAIDFVRRLNPGMTFREAVLAIGGDLPRSPDRPTPSLTPAVVRTRIDRPEGWQDFARRIVAEAESVLWSARGTEARTYLGGRGLREDTIRAAHLGYRPADEYVEGVFPDLKVWVPGGIVIPWFDGPDVVLINVRRSEGKPKYVAVKGSRRGGIYPGRSRIVRGLPIVIAEGEFDSLLLGQELDGLSSVVTLGSASDRPDPRVLNAILKASPWFIASDTDDAGERSAENWLAISDRSVRVSPPKEYGKDWTDAYQNGLNLRAWWARYLAQPAVESAPTYMSIGRSLDLTENPIGSPPDDFIIRDAVAPVTNRWRCLSRNCRNMGRWWMSQYGVVLCMHCLPPAFPWLVVAEGDETDAPIVDPDRSNQARHWTPTIPGRSGRCFSQT